MATWQEIFEDVNIPDTMEVDLGERGKLKLGDLRTEYKKQVSNLTQGFQKLSDRERSIKAREDALVAASPVLSDIGSLDGLEGIPEDLRSVVTVDPALRAVLSLVQQHGKEVAQLRTEGSKALEQLNKTFWSYFHAQTLDQILREDSEIDREKLLRFAVDNQIPDLRRAYREMTRDRDMDKVQKRAYEEGLKKGKEDASIPFIPASLRPATAPKPAEGAPKTAAELADKALMDPDVLRSFVEGSVTG